MNRPLRPPHLGPIECPGRAPRRWSRRQGLGLAAAGAGLAGAVLAASIAAPAHAVTLRIGGVLTAPGDVIERWSWSGAWIYPVGDPHAFTRPDSSDTAGYRVLRSVLRDSSGAVRHAGVDLGNRRAGGVVRAAANGLVVRAANDNPRGYGDTVVLAHRLEGGGLAYSVYAHLREGSIAVHEGSMVAAGQTLGRVGRTGNASTAHLHFEIRKPRDPGVRWEHATVEDPLAFVSARLPSLNESSRARPYLEWAQCSALIARNARAEVPLERGAWWEMLVRAARHSLRDLPSDVGLARRALLEAGVLAKRGNRETQATVGWPELERDLRRLAQVGVRLPACAALAESERAAAGSPDSVSTARPRARRKPPTLGDACLALAELASPERSEEPTAAR